VLLSQNAYTLIISRLFRPIIFELTLRMTKINQNLQKKGDNLLLQENISLALSKILITTPQILRLFLNLLPLISFLTSSFNQSINQSINFIYSIALHYFSQSPPFFERISRLNGSLVVEIQKVFFYNS